MSTHDERMNRIKEYFDSLTIEEYEKMAIETGILDYDYSGRCCSPVGCMEQNYSMLRQYIMCCSDEGINCKYNSHSQLES